METKNKLKRFFILTSSLILTFMILESFFPVLSQGTPRECKNSRRKVNIIEYTISVPPTVITAGPDGNLWFTEYGSNDIAKVGKITTDGIITKYDIPTNNSYLANITTGPDGNLWFVERYHYKNGKIGKITTDGIVTEYDIQGNPYDITTGPDGNLWFTETPLSEGSGMIGKITIDGMVTEYNIPINKNVQFIQPLHITAGPDGNLWFIETLAGAVSKGESEMIGKITTDGIITEYNIQDDIQGQAFGITTGPDGNLWFTIGTRIGKITTNGFFTLYNIPFNTSRDYEIPLGITTGPDGNLWFVEYFGSKIVKVTTDGRITKYKTPVRNSAPRDITTGPDGNLWFVEEIGKIGKIVLPCKRMKKK